MERVSNIDIPAGAPTQINRLTQHFLFRIALFAISVAAGYYVSQSLYTRLWRTPRWRAALRQEATPAVDKYHTLHSGFSN